jgi:pimeloyl-ACP methyl ester carboxylesterase
VKRLVNGIYMNYQDVGAGPVLLLVHGFPLDHTLWVRQVEALQDDYRLIVPDLRGHGQTQAPQAPYRINQMADDLRALLLALDVKKVTLVGLSMGGYVALSFWHIYPHLVRALVLADTRAVADTPQTRLNRQTMIERVQAGEQAAIVEEMLPSLLAGSTLQDNPQVVEHVRRMMNDTPPAGLVGALRGMIKRRDATPALSNLTVPTLIAVGEHDALTPPAQAKDMQLAILAPRRGRISRRTVPPPVTLTLIPGAGRLAPLENPAAFNRALREFLDGLPG